MRDIVPYLFHLMYLEKFLENFSGEIQHRRNLLQVYRDALPSAFLQCLAHCAALAKTTWAYQHEMVGTSNILFNIPHLLNSVSEEFSVNNSAEFERVLFTTHNFVTNIFVIQKYVSFLVLQNLHDIVKSSLDYHQLQASMNSDGDITGISVYPLKCFTFEVIITSQLPYSAHRIWRESS